MALLLMVPCAERHHCSRLHTYIPRRNKKHGLRMHLQQRRRSLPARRRRRPSRGAFAAAASHRRGEPCSGRPMSAPVASGAR